MCNRDKICFACQSSDCSRGGGTSRGLQSCWSRSLPHSVHVCQPRRDWELLCMKEAACPSLPPVPKGGGKSGDGERQRSSLCSRALPQPPKSQVNATNVHEALRIRSVGVTCRRGKMLNAQRDDGGNGIDTLILEVNQETITLGMIRNDGEASNFHRPRSWLGCKPNFTKPSDG